MASSADAVVHFCHAHRGRDDRCRALACSCLICWPQRGVDSVIVETRSEAYVLGLIRAGILEHSSVELFALSASAIG